VASVSHSSDARQFRQQLERAGYDVLRTGSGHYEVRHRGHYEVRHRGQRVATFPVTPGDRRWKKNALADIRRWERQAASLLP
jgi:hypothetical protein